MIELRDDEGVVARSWVAGDAAMLHAAGQLPSLRREFPEPLPTVQAAAEWIEARAKDSDEGTGYVLAVLDDGVPVGTVAVTKIEHRHQTGWVSYWLLDDARGKGRAARAVRALARWAFDELGLYRLELGHRVDNPASCRVAVAAGFVAEGIERSRLRYDGVRYDCETHARLADDPEPVTPRSGSAGRP